jgi:transcriptional regulator with XRE-family HTH domain
MDLATASGVSERTIARFESGEAILPKRVRAVQEAFEAAGVTFLLGGKLEGGVVPPQVGQP